MKKELYRMPLPVRWGDMDAMGHVNNTLYFRYAEEARAQWFNPIGKRLFPNRQAAVLVHTACSFKRQLRHPSTLEVVLYLTHIGRTSFDMSYEMWEIDDPTKTLVAEVTARTVCK